MQPEYTFLDEELAKRITLRAIQSDSDLRGIYIASSGRTGVYQAIRQTGLADRIHVIVHDVTPDNMEMVREGIVDFIIGQDEQAQGNYPFDFCMTTWNIDIFPKTAFISQISLSSFVTTSIIHHNPLALRTQINESPQGDS